MRFAELLARIDRVQQGLWFKVIASVLVLVLGIGAVVTYSVSSAASSLRRDEALRSRMIEVPAEPATPPASEAERIERARREAAQSINRVLSDLDARRLSTAHVGVGIALACGVCWAIIWIGLALTYLGITIVGAVLAGLLYGLSRAGVPGAEGAWGLWPVALGALVLAASFAALMRVIRLLCAYPHPVLAIAQNVLAEATRMRVALVFIVLLVAMLAGLPLMLDPENPLRYRVQSFLQYAVAGTSGLVAVLCVFLSAASVAFDQRDKTIWGTMTKPVRPWHYVLGKWLGIVGLAAVLLGVSSTGVFLFTEYLRRTQTAVGEQRPYVPADPQTIITEDRLALEYQILVGRRAAQPRMPADLDARIEQAYQLKLDDARRQREQDPALAGKPIDQRALRNEAEKELAASFFSVGAGESRVFEFAGLEVARGQRLPLTLRYKINSGTNDPTAFYHLTLGVPGESVFVRTVPLGQTLTELLSPDTIKDVPLTTKSGGNTGEVEILLPLQVTNGDLERRVANSQTITFPPGGLEVSYPVSGFEGNFLRVMLVVWLKIAFMSMIAVVAATFLSFPVACLTSFGTYFIAESSSFLNKALEYYSVYDDKDNSILWDRFFIKPIARVVSNLFAFYGDLSPTDSLVDGRLVSWDAVTGAFFVFGIVLAALFALGAYILQRRELATYSGQ